ncbi:hypothetical protein LCM10_01785 [Rossellomorea aquimaris]|uniref:hypothetical protein n=1 Tax=Rossellomorea aquimaris TaxID=189382 RepID=UPI001CD2C6BD|nr:hypothetical protein [Rossellomorea aquimaris]MCA1053701.1 hypothetical protein [Rossellomorea aquimaris]
MNSKLLIAPALGVMIMLGMFVRNDARILHIEPSELPVNRTLAVDISKRYLAGWWTSSEKLDDTPYEMKEVMVLNDEISVELLDERDSSECKGYEVVVNKDNGLVMSKEDVDFCSGRF